MDATLIYFLIYAIIGLIAGGVMIVVMITNWGMCSGGTLLAFYAFTALLWPVAVPLILAAIKANKDEEERK